MHHLKWKNSSGCKVTWPVFTWNPALLGPHPVIFDPRLSLEASLLLFGIRTNSLCSSCKVFFLYDTRRNLCMIVCVEYFKVCFIHCLRGCVSRIPRSLPVYVLGCRHVCVRHEALHEALISHDWEERQTVTERRAGLDVWPLIPRATTVFAGESKNCT